MRSSPGSDRRRTRGASGVEYAIVVVLVGIAGVAGFRLFQSQYRCRVVQATSKFSDSSTGEGGCKDEGAPSTVASSSPPPKSAGDDTPDPGIVCVGSTCSGDQCFVAGTLVLTESGPQPIESLTVGTRVWSRDQSGDAVDWKPVARTFVHHTKELIELGIGDEDAPEVLRVTPEHLIHSRSRGWVAAGSLVPGSDVLVDEAGRDVPIVSGVSVASSVDVYNVEVADFHTYFVGEHALWAHNACSRHKPWGDPDCPRCQAYDAPPAAYLPPNVQPYMPPAGGFPPGPSQYGPPAAGSHMIWGHGMLPIYPDGGGGSQIPMMTVPPNTQVTMYSPPGTKIKRKGHGNPLAQGLPPTQPLPGGGYGTFGPGDNVPNWTVRPGDGQPHPPLPLPPNPISSIYQPPVATSLNHLIVPGRHNHIITCAEGVCPPGFNPDNIGPYNNVQSRYYPPVPPPTGNTPWGTPASGTSHLPPTSPSPGRDYSWDPETGKWLRYSRSQGGMVDQYGNYIRD